MSNEHLGFVEQRAGERERYAKFFYRAPVILTAAIDTAKLAARIADLEAENATLKVQAEDLESQNARLRAQGRYVPLQSVAKPREVAEIFCQTLKEVGYEISGRPYSMDDLQARRRSQVMARPRHVFMWVAGQACSGDSLAAIGRFLQRDHTSVMHGRQRATKIMREDATLRGVALAALATFGIKVAE